jgi:hypothetical protein
LDNEKKFRDDQKKLKYQKFEEINKLTEKKHYQEIDIEVDDSIHEIV